MKPNDATRGIRKGCRDSCIPRNGERRKIVRAARERPTLTYFIRKHPFPRSPPEVADDTSWLVSLMTLSSRFCARAARGTARFGALNCCGRKKKEKEKGKRKKKKKKTTKVGRESLLETFARGTRRNLQRIFKNEP